MEDTWRGTGAGKWLSANGGLGVAGHWWCDGVALSVNPHGGGHKDSLRDLDVVSHNDELAFCVLVCMNVTMATVWLGGDAESAEEDSAEGDEGGLHDCGRTIIGFSVLSTLKFDFDFRL